MLWSCIQFCWKLYYDPVHNSVAILWSFQIFLICFCEFTNLHEMIELVKYWYWYIRQVKFSSAYFFFGAKDVAGLASDCTCVHFLQCMNTSRVWACKLIWCANSHGNMLPETRYFLLRNVLVIFFTGGICDSWEMSVGNLLWETVGRGVNPLKMFAWKALLHICTSAGWNQNKNVPYHAWEVEIGYWWFCQDMSRFLSIHHTNSCTPYELMSCQKSSTIDQGELIRQYEGDFDECVGHMMWPTGIWFLHAFTLFGHTISLENLYLHNVLTITWTPMGLQQMAFCWRPWPCGLRLFCFPAWSHSFFASFKKNSPKNYYDVMVKGTMRHRAPTASFSRPRLPSMLWPKQAKYGPLKKTAVVNQPNADFKSFFSTFYFMVKADSDPVWVII